MTREELRTRALTALNDSTTAPVFWNLNEVNQLLNEAQEVLAEEVEALTRTVYIPERPGVMFYSLRGVGVGLMTPWRLWTRNRQHRLWPISMTEMDGHYERWLTVTGQPEWWGVLSWDTIFVWPAPTTGGGVFELDCFIWPEPLADDASEPETPDPDHDWLLDYVLMEGQVKQWDVALALGIGQPLFQRAKDSQARAGLRAVQERFFGREAEGNDLRA